MTPVATVFRVAAGVEPASSCPRRRGDEKTGWSAQAPLEAGWQTNLSALERSLVERALRQAEGNRSRAAELLGIHRRLLYEKLRQYKIE